MSSSSSLPSTRSSFRATSPDTTAADLAATAADTAAAMPSSDDSVPNSGGSAYEPTSDDWAAAAKEDAEDAEDAKGGAIRPNRTNRQVMNPQSISRARFHQFYKRSLLPLDDPNWCDPAGGIPPRDKDGKIPAEYKDMLALMFHALHKRREGTDLALVKAVQEDAAASLSRHPGE
ncbi:hypothetical protein BCR44DRAFT_49527 [Catenaria anguillulae PL171]|uniref:Uncharacterized protein n=1 Tax=Catenaria anguillulae PL171 TaxID=765915 RepID=A0A1Y2HPL6_9FUNG|nr:hypothetical protein BCR44DRAFT_49527 [Catenaria anguillulae PL171]